MHLFWIILLYKLFVDRKCQLGNFKYLDRLDILKSFAVMKVFLHICILFDYLDPFCWKDCKDYCTSLRPRPADLQLVKILSAWSLLNHLLLWKTNNNVIIPLSRSPLLCVWNLRKPLFSCWWSYLKQNTFSNISILWAGVVIVL